MWSGWRIAAVAVLVGGIVACGEESDEDAVDWQANQLMVDTLPDATPAGASETGNAAEGLTVTLTEWNIRLASDTVDAGPTTIRVRNIGEFPHVLEVEGQGVEVETAALPPGEWATLEVELEPGTYELYCPLDDEHGDHDRMGMRKYLVARPAPAEGAADSP